MRWNTEEEIRKEWNIRKKEKERERNTEKKIKYVKNKKTLAMYIVSLNCEYKYNSHIRI